MSKVKQLLSDTFIFAIGNVLSKMILFFLMPLYTTILTTEQYGIADIINNTVELAFPIITLSITEAVFRFSIDENTEHKKIFSIGINIISKGSIIVILLVAFVNHFVKYEYAWYFVFMLLVYAVKCLFAHFARGLGYVKIFALNGIITSITLVAFNIIFLLVLKMQLQGYLMAVIFSNLSGLIFVFIKAKLYLYIDLKAIDKKLAKEMLHYGIPMMPNLLSWWITNTSSRYVVLAFSGVGAAGMFAAASKLPAMINLLSSIFQQAWQYSSSKEFGKKDSDKFYNDVYRFYSAFITVACSGVMLLVPHFSIFLLRGDFYSAWHYVPLLLYSATLGCYSVYFGTIYVACKKNKMLMISTIVGAILNIGVALCLVPFWGIYGALLGSVISYAVIVIIRIKDIKKYVQINSDLNVLLPVLIIIFIQSLVMTISSKYMTIISVLCFIIICIINCLYLKNDLIKGVKLIQLRHKIS